VFVGILDAQFGLNSCWRESEIETYFTVKLKVVLSVGVYRLAQASELLYYMAESMLTLAESLVLCNYRELWRVVIWCNSKLLEVADTLKH